MSDRNAIADVARKWIATYNEIEAQCRINVEAFSGDIRTDGHARLLQCVAERCSRDYRLARLADEAKKLLEIVIEEGN